MDTNSTLNLESLAENVHAALRFWHKLGGPAESMLDYLMLVKQHREELSSQDNSSLLRLATNKVLLSAISELEKQEQQEARVLRLRFPDDNKIIAVAHKLNVSEHTVSRHQRSGILHLAEILFGQENALRKRRAQEIEALLPPSNYTRIFGTDEAQTKLQRQLAENGYWVVALVGIGGIGKTALADTVIRNIIQNFIYDEVIWLRAEAQTMSGRFLSPELTYEAILSELAQQLWPVDGATLSPERQQIQVHQALKLRRFLIVIDNLETEQDTAFLLSHLNNLANPSKFLLTSRTRLAEQASVFNFSLNELSLIDAGDLIRHHAAEIGVIPLVKASSEDVMAIFNLTGGNPLAMKLVVSLLDVLPLPQVLAALSTGDLVRVDQLYKHIYWQTWQILSPPARSLLQAMPLVSELGALPDYLQQISGLSAAQFWPAIQELHNRSLIETRGTIHEKRYGIHRLTDTFLRTEIIHWPDD